MPDLNPPDPSNAIAMEWCRRSTAYFLDNFGYLKTDPGDGNAGNETGAGWQRFSLWPDQRPVLDLFERERLVDALKARQLGITWLVLGHCVKVAVFRPGSTILLFSARDDEAKELLSRCRGMYERLPDWMKPRQPPRNRRARPGKDNDSVWELPNGSKIMCFPANAGRSYTASIVVVDEADWLKPPHDLGFLLDAIKPTIDAGGKLFLISTVDKGRPESLFKRIYLNAMEGKNSYKGVFLPWSARPDRNASWYAEQVKDSIANHGSLDHVHQEYPASAEEALAPRSLDKRFPAGWLLQCFQALPPAVIPSHQHPKPPAIPGLLVYKIALPGRKYLIGADPAEGNPTSDDSALVVLDQDTGEEVCSLAGRLEISTFSAYIDQISTYYNHAPALIERNNHGHAVLAKVKTRTLCGLDGKAGWLTQEKSKSQMLATAADCFRDKETLIHTQSTFHQLASIEGSSQRAPEGMHDDRAVAYCLALVALVKSWRTGKFRPSAHHGASSRNQIGAVRHR